MSEELKGWKELPIGGIILDAGNTDGYITGSWRSFRPIHDKEKCNNCLLCWIFCPDSAIVVEEDKFNRFDYDHCKGCMICVAQCPPHAIVAIAETEAQKHDQAHEQAKEKTTL